MPPALFVSVAAMWTMAVMTPGSNFLAAAHTPPHAHFVTIQQQYGRAEVCGPDTRFFAAAANRGDRQGTAGSRRAPLRLKRRRS